jgi:hypothetical protein
MVFLDQRAGSAGGGDQDATSGWAREVGPEADISPEIGARACGRLYVDLAIGEGNRGCVVPIESTRSGSSADLASVLACSVMAANIAES